MNKCFSQIGKLCIFLILWQISLMSFAHDFEEDGIYYNITSSSEVEVTYPGNNSFGHGQYSGSVIIPESVTYGGIIYSVKSVGRSAFEECIGLTSVTIGENVTSIGNWAFSNCTGLTTISLPDSVTSIGNDAFSGCTGLTTISLPDSVTSIGYHAFYGCSSLTSTIILNGITRLEEHTFGGCSKLSSVIIGNNVTSIEERAFYKCESLPTISIPDNVTNIGKYAFGNCSGLTSVIIGKSVTSIEDNAFYNCPNLTLVVNHSNLNITRNSSSHGSVGNRAERILYGENVNGFYFANKADEHILTGYLGDEPNIIMPKSYKGQGYIIGEGAFFKCDNLATITLGDSVTNIGCEAFFGCASLQTISIPNSVKSVGEYAFFNCKKLTSVIIGNSVTSIGEKAFSSCTKIIKLISLAKTPPTCEASVFDYNMQKKCTLIIPEGSRVSYQTASQWRDFSLIEEMPTEPRYKITYVVDGLIVYSDSLVCGAAIKLPKDPVKIGHTFCGWNDVPETMPAEDITITGSFTVNKYELKYIVDGEVWATDSVEYATTITLRESPTKEGHTFNGWGEVPKTMPAEDMIVTGSFKVNKYEVKFVVEGITIAKDSVEYGATIALREEPQKEGHTFSGWSEVPETMPAEEVIVTGSFTVNKYLLTFVIDEVVFATDSVDYGAKIVLPDVPEKENYTFAWEEERPKTMPACDVTIHGSYITGIRGVENERKVDVYTISGILYKKGMNANQLEKELPRGLYIIDGKKFRVK